MNARTLTIEERGVYLNEEEVSRLMDLLVDAFGYGSIPPIGRRQREEEEESELASFG